MSDTSTTAATASPPPEPRPAEYVGWLKTPRTAWREVSRGPTASVAFRELLTKARGIKHCETIVLAEGEHPSDRQRIR